MSIASKIVTLSTAFAFMTSSASAEEGFYAGIGLSLGHMLSKAEFPTGATADDYSSGTLIGGYRKQADIGFWALEAQLEIPFNDELTSAGVPCSVGATAAYGCEVDGVLRLRGVYGTEIQNGLEAYATAGFVIISGDAASSPTTTDSTVAGGFSIGVGMQKAITPTLKLRGEINHDMAKIGLSDISGPGIPPNCCDPSFVFTSLQISLVKSF
jgi:opacity protein-like surface antigen